MGVLNTTPDSFSDGGKYLNLDNAVTQAQRMISDGADIIDVGGESTRPGANPVPLVDEIDRVIPVIDALNSSAKVNLSIDTSKPKVMELAVERGANLINDVCALSMPGAMEVASSLDVDVCLMHMQGSPRSMQSNPTYADVVDDIKQFFDKRINACVNAGMSADRIILDPGFGFGKTLEHNIEILKRFNEFDSFGLRTLAGLSRKSMIGAMLGNRETDGRVVGSVIGSIIALNNGADIVRVHDVLETKDAIDIWSIVNG